jgi:hypothetical protein
MKQFPLIVCGYALGCALVLDLDLERLFCLLILDDCRSLLCDLDRDLPGLSGQSLIKCLRVAEEIITNREKINECVSTINEHEDKLLNSERFRLFVSSIVDHSIETIFPSEIVEPGDYIENLVDKGKNIKESMKQLNAMNEADMIESDKIAERQARRREDARRREEEIRVFGRKMREEIEKRDQELKAEIAQSRAENERQRKETEKLLNPFYAFGALFEDVCNSIPVIGKPILDFYRKIRYLAYFGMFILRKLIENRFVRLNTLIRAVKYSVLLIVGLLVIGLIYYFGAIAYRVGKNSIFFMIDLFKSLYGF